MNPDEWRCAKRFHDRTRELRPPIVCHGTRLLNTAAPAVLSLGLPRRRGRANRGEHHSDLSDCRRAGGIDSAVRCRAAGTPGTGRSCTPAPTPPEYRRSRWHGDAPFDHRTAMHGRRAGMHGSCARRYGRCAWRYDACTGRYGRCARRYDACAGRYGRRIGRYGRRAWRYGRCAWLTRIVFEGNTTRMWRRKRRWRGRGGRRGVRLGRL